MSFSGFIVIKCWLDVENVDLSVASSTVFPTDLFSNQNLSSSPLNPNTNIFRPNIPHIKFNDDPSKNGHRFDHHKRMGNVINESVSFSFRFTKINPHGKHVTWKTGVGYYTILEPFFDNENLCVCSVESPAER
jgi:hypothetical protein